MTILLSLLAAATYGSADFLGGLFSRRVSPWTIAFVAQVGGALVVAVVALIAGGDPTGADLAWCLLAGLGNGFGTAFLYRGLSAGRMGVVAPLSGVGAALLPVVVAGLGGERPGAVVWLGVLVAMPAIWLVAREPTSVEGRGGAGATGALDGALAGLGFGTLLASLAQITESAGLLPLALNQLVGGAVIAVIATALRQPWWPREGRAALGVASGVLGATATGLFLVASQGGFLTITAVVTSLYPAVTVLLAAVLLRERIRRAQGGGLALCALAVVLVAVG